MSRKTISISQETYDELLSFKLELSVKKGKPFSFGETIKEMLKVVKGRS